MKLSWMNKKTIDYDYVQERLGKCLENGVFSNFGSNVSQLEQELHSLLKLDANKKVIVVCNGALALNALVACYNYYSDRRLVFATQSFTFPCSGQLFLENSLILDIDQNMGCNIEHLESKKDLFDGIVITNSFGRCTNIQSYIDFCTTNNKILLFDNASTSYTFYKGKNSLNYGNGSIISLHHTKPIGFGEGGAIIVDDKYYETCRRMISFGYHGNDRTHYSPFASNCKMSEISAIYISQWLKNFDMIKSNLTFLRKYFEDKLTLETVKDFADVDQECIVSTIPVIFPSKIDTQFFNENGVEAKKYYVPLSDDTPVSQSLYERLICFPLHCDMTYQDIDYTIDLINLVLNKMI